MTRLAVLLAAMAVASCAGLDRNDTGNLQPQAVSGPCDVKKFFLLRFTAVPTTMSVTNDGAACSFTILNPAQQFVITAALVTVQPSHGVAVITLPSLARQAAVAYTPAPGYVGPDRFTITLEPNDVAIAVTVEPGRRPG